MALDEEIRKWVLEQIAESGRIITGAYTEKIEALDK